MQKLRTAIVCCCILFVCGCVPKKKDDFNRTALLTNLYNSNIAPGYISFFTSTEALKASADAFLLNPDNTKLDSLKTAFLLAYKNFQAVEMYDFTASGDMRNALNSFPTDTTQINSNIISGVYDLNTANNIRAKGFPAVDFILFGKSSADVVATFTSSPQSKQYLNDIVQEIRNKAGAAVAGWNSFETDFVNASGTDVGSSVGMLVNDLSFAAERNRRERVGNPLGYIGIISGGVVLPDAVEAYHCNYSKELLIENLQKLKSLYEGGAGTGFDDYLNHIGADYNGTPLATEISNQFNRTILAAQNIPVALSVAVTSNNAEMQTLFLELKKLVVLLKVDMSSQLGVIINYSDNDGD